MKKKSSGGEGGSNWMDTYGDMVTLLLCFFVLLYSMSTIDENKWKQVAMSFNPNATRDQTNIGGTASGIFQDPDATGDPGVTDPTELEKEQENVDQQMEDLYEAIKQYIDASGVNIEVTKGDGGVFLSMRDTIFFEPNEAVMLQAGQKILEDLAPIIAKVAPSIDQIRVMGHTASVNDGQPADIYFDWTLSSSRAAVVVATLQELCPELNPARWKTEGNAQYLPVAPNDSEENRRKNRRVEMVIKGKDLLNQMGDSIEQYETLRVEGPSKSSTSSEVSDVESSSSTVSSESTPPASSSTESQEG